MSYYLSQLEGEERKRECDKNDRALEVFAFSRLDTHRALQVPRYPRTLGAAFNTPEYANPIEYHIKPSVWVRLSLFLKRRFAS